MVRVAPLKLTLVRVAPSKLTLAEQSHRAVQSEFVRVRAQLSIHDFSDCRWWLYSNVWQPHPHIVSGNKTHAQSNKHGICCR